MDKFLEVVYSSQIAESAEKGDKCIEFFQPLMDEIKGIVNEKVYERLSELFMACASRNDSYYAVEGMKLAISIMDGSYVPQV